MQVDTDTTKLVWEPDPDQSSDTSATSRLKPDLQGTTLTWTAANCEGEVCSDTAIQRFAGTSGSAPYVAAAASLLRNWLIITRGKTDRRTGVDPGQVYAQLILSGRKAWTPKGFVDSKGVGVLRLPPLEGLAWWGKVIVNPGDTLDIPLDIGPVPPDTLDAALWWPNPLINGEDPSSSPAFNNIDLYLLNPSDQIRAASKSPHSVFERAHLVVGSESEAPGTWTLRIAGVNVSYGPQTVYWTARARLRKGS